MARQNCAVEDVAAAAAVSTMTVSRAINGRPGVGVDLRRHVLETAAGLGYLPSHVARAVNVDNRSGAEEAVAYLVGLGRRRVAFIAGPAASLSGRRRLSGYRSGLRAGGLSSDPDLVERCIPTLEGGAAALRSLLHRVKGIDAILAYNDLVAIGALRALEESGRAAPRLQPP